MLESYRCPYDATAVELLYESGAFVPGKTALDEFGMGSATDSSELGRCVNPWNREMTAGGSSGGSAAAVAAGMVPAALGSDTGGSIRQPAAFCGVYGLKPTYGAISRYGLVAYASSLDTIGIIADTPERLAALFGAIAAEDPRDQTSSARPEGDGETERPAGQAVAGGVSTEASSQTVDNSTATADPAAGGAQPAGRAPTPADLRIGILSGDLGLSGGVAAVYRETIDRLSAAGATTVEITLPCLEYAAAVYYTIATAEASANLARFDGVRYGRRPDYAENPEELTRLARSAGLGDEVKLRILLGTFVLRSGFHDQYYARAQRLRTRITNELAAVFEQCDTVLAPVFPTTAFPLGESGPDGLARKQADRFTSVANLAGIPALSLPAGLADNLPVGLQLVGPHWSEPRLISLAQQLHREQAPPKPPDFPWEWS